MKKMFYTKVALSALTISMLASCANLNLKSTAEGENTESSYLGTISYQNQTISKASAEMLNREIDLQRASQIALWAMPITSMYQGHEAAKSNLGFTDDEVVIGLYEGYDGVYPFITANVTTPYTVSNLDLSATGPVVVNIPAGGIFGVGNNAWQEPIVEIGSGKAETLLFVGPGQDYPKDFKGKIVHSDTFVFGYFYRVLGLGAAADALKTGVTSYKLSEAANPPETKYITYDFKGGENVTIATQPRGMAYWDLVNKYIQKEPMADRDRFFYAWLKDLGIEKGKPFNPTAYQKEILLEGVNMGMAMGQAIAFNKTKEKFASSLYGNDSGWEDAMAGMDPKIDLDTYSMFNERTSYTYEAVTTSSGMVSKVPGKGSAYLGSYYDANGNALMGSNNYSLHIEPNPPAALFWSITVYDIENRLIIRNKSRRSDLSSRSESLVTNSDGSVDLYFGPEAPEGKENNWIQSNEDESYFLYLRLYGPEQEYFDQAYPMNKIKKVD